MSQAMLAAQPKELFFESIPFALGNILVVSDGEKLCAVDFSNYEERMMRLLEQRFHRVTLVPASRSHNVSGSFVAECVNRIRAYLAGDFSSLNEIPVSLGGTPFQQKVWLALRKIPIGTVFTYKQLATEIGHPTAYRAVGMTNSLNPISIVLPCHRVIGANQKLTGYAGGLERKRWLLQHEGVEI